MSSALIEVNISGIYIYVNHPIIRSHNLSLSLTLYCRLNQDDDHRGRFSCASSDFLPLFYLSGSVFIHFQSEL